MQALGVSYRFCRASFTVRVSAHLRCAESKKRACLTELRHLLIDNRLAVLHHCRGLPHDGMPNANHLTRLQSFQRGVVVALDDEDADRRIGMSVEICPKRCLVFFSIVVLAIDGSLRNIFSSLIFR
jgi:hypothetical protein